jgi:hypothetical protein
MNLFILLKNTAVITSILVCAADPLLATKRPTDAIEEIDTQQRKYQKPFDDRLVSFIDNDFFTSFVTRYDEASKIEEDIHSFFKLLFFTFYSSVNIPLIISDNSFFIEALHHRWSKLKTPFKVDVFQKCFIDLKTKLIDKNSSLNSDELRKNKAIRTTKVLIWFLKYCSKNPEFKGFTFNTSTWNNLSQDKNDFTEYVTEYYRHSNDTLSATTFIPNFQNLRKFSLKNNRLQLSCIKKILKQIELSKINAVNIEGINLQKTSKELVSMVKNNSYLTELYLGSNNLLGSQMCYLLEALYVNKSINILQIQGASLNFKNYLFENASHRIEKLFTDNNHIQSLALTLTKSMDKESDHQFNWLRTHQFIETLEFNHSSIKALINDTFFQALRDNPSLTSLYFLDTPVDLVRLSIVYNEKPQLQHLGVSDSGSDPDFFLDISPILPMIGQSKSLRTIQIKGNKSLHLQDLRNNLPLFLDSIKKNKSLHSINISYNHLNDDHILSLSTILKTNTNVTYLNLSFNRITMDGLNHLFEMLKENKTINILILQGFSKTNRLSQENINEVKEKTKATIQFRGKHFDLGI